MNKRNRAKSNRKSRLMTLCMALLLVLSMGVTTAGTPENVQAAGGLSSYKKVSSYKTRKVGSTTYSMKYNSKSGRQIIYARKNGKKRVLAKNCISGTVVTNGKYLYYESGNYISSGSFGGNYRNRKVVRLTVSSGKVQGIVTYKGEGRAHSMLGCDGTYLYMGEQTQYGDGLSVLNTLNLKTKRIKKITADCSTVQTVKNKRLITAVGFPHGGPVYLINKDGSGCKYITKRAISVKVKGNYIYYTEATYDWKTRKCRCDLNGNNKKALTAWGRMY